MAKRLPGLRAVYASTGQICGRRGALGRRAQGVDPQFEHPPPGARFQLPGGARGGEQQPQVERRGVGAQLPSARAAASRRSSDSTVDSERLDHGRML